MNKIQGRTLEFVVQNVLLCLSCLFMYILANKFITKWKNSASKKKKLKT